MTKPTFKHSISIITYILSVISCVTASSLRGRNSLGAHPFVVFENANENIANSEAANVNILDISAFNAAEAATAVDKEQQTTFLHGKRNFLNYRGSIPFLVLENSLKNIASSEAAYINQFDLEALNSAENAASVNNEKHTTFLLGKRNPFIVLENADKKVASAEAAHVNQLDVHALNAAEAANSKNKEQHDTFLLGKRMILYQDPDGDSASAEAASVNQLDVHALNAAETANNKDNEQHTTFLLGKRNFLNYGRGIPFVVFENANENT
ncbi:11568_t:CDS:1 [Racocetra persica]|uniref:11568_t:CDS:1 n=1 Tax=Racocetra persica TaxID=160502 RepID=A0ACA9L2V8_9GLOM|nr:11568_t:CDS:1 [Racocetra persica]